ncbi:hypothetical protein Pcinc_003726 [Petrolisthes cinctipes]|uniref:Uncharacterized protein n=1 Tax=Petrolisthes cinctipes TaxID=88211 RepID=A0AAE1L4H4_PETCI|nr:hypothetical protein Pcinc_003726 [Petrolisthes cinctipes]
MDTFVQESRPVFSSLGKNLFSPFQPIAIFKEPEVRTIKSRPPADVRLLKTDAVPDINLPKRTHNNDSCDNIILNQISLVLASFPTTTPHQSSTYLARLAASTQGTHSSPTLCPASRLARCRTPPSPLSTEHRSSNSKTRLQILKLRSS